ncbi:MAG TPA: hypothetical protein VFZ66_29695 [Herpetosiphonaceae bacterium]
MARRATPPRPVPSTPTPETFVRGALSPDDPWIALQLVSAMAWRRRGDAARAKLYLRRWKALKQAMES